MSTFKINQIFKDEVCVGGKASGQLLREKIETELAKGPIMIDFEGTDLITQGFSDEFLGPILIENGQDVFRRIKFKNCSDDVQAIILSTARRFLLDMPSISYFQ